ncbi:MAG: peptidase, partial [Planctomycetes bacterium]|nr:peptidase [Planctomycetota bacterium]
ASVEQVTHIAPADENGQIIGADVEQNGVINYAVRELGLCTGVTDATFTTTTEVYPDSPKVTDADCNRAQVAAVIGGLDYVLSRPRQRRG